MGTFERVVELVGQDFALATRLKALQDFSRTVRTSEYHLTNACNIRCKGCWFFAYDYDRKVHEIHELSHWREFAERERTERKITTALLIGGEPTLYPERIAVWVETVPNVTISSNGLNKLPVEGFENVCVALTLFGGGIQDDELRAIRPNGKTFTGLLDKVLANYKDDPRAVFIYAVSRESLSYIDETVRRIGDNGNRLGLNYYSSYGLVDPLRRQDDNARLLDEVRRVRSLYPHVVGSEELFIETVITGKTHFGTFGYDTCPSISVDHPAHTERLKNGNKTLPGFNAYAPDLKTVNFCCTSGHCSGCRDSQAVYSWLLVSFPHYLDSRQNLLRWLAMAESYWSGFIWSPYHPSRRVLTQPRKEASPST
jgi:hypothetical protein